MFLLIYSNCFSVGLQFPCCAHHQPGWSVGRGHHPDDAPSLLQPPAAVPGGPGGGDADGGRAHSSLTSCKSPSARFSHSSQEWHVALW